MVAQTVLPGYIMKSWVAEKRPNFAYKAIAHLPSAHIAGIQGYRISPFYLVGHVYWMPKFDFAQFLEYNKNYSATFLATVPPIYLLIAKSIEITDQFHTLEIAISGAAPLGKDLQHTASQRLGGPDCFIDQTWGLLKTTGSTTIMQKGIHESTGSVGPLLPNMLARLVDDNGRDVKPRKSGEVLVKGTVVCRGYYQNEAADKESFTGYWSHTGNVAEFRNGLFYIVDGKKELIKYKCLQVAPVKLEDLLSNLPDIINAAVIRFETSDRHDELPRAYVVAEEFVFH